MPIPPCTRGSWSAFAYWRRPGFEMRFRPLITGSRSSVYLSRMRSAWNSAVVLWLLDPGGRSVFSTAKPYDVALLLQHPCELLVHARGRDHDVVVVRVDRVPDARQEVCD